MAPFVFDDAVNVVRVEEILFPCARTDGIAQSQGRQRHAEVYVKGYILVRRRAVRREAHEPCHVGQTQTHEHLRQRRHNGNLDGFAAAPNVAWQANGWRMKRQRPRAACGVPCATRDPSSGLRCVAIGRGTSTNSRSSTLLTSSCLFASTKRGCSSTCPWRQSSLRWWRMKGNVTRCGTLQKGKEKRSAKE